MHHIKVIKDGNVNNVVKEQLVDGVQYVDDEPREGSLNGITSGAVAKAVGNVAHSIAPRSVLDALIYHLDFDSKRSLLVNGTAYALNVDIGDSVDLDGYSSDGYYSYKVACKKGDVFKIAGRGGRKPRLWGFTDSDGKLLSAAEADATQESLITLVAEQDGYFIYNSIGVIYRDFLVAKYSSEFSKDISQINAVMSENLVGKALLFDSKRSSLVYGTAYALNVGIGNTVDLDGYSSDGYYSYKVACKKGDIFKLAGRGGNKPRLWGFTDSDGKLLSAAKADVTQESLITLVAEQDGYFIYNSIGVLYRDLFVTSSTESLRTRVTNLENETNHLAKISENRLLANIDVKLSAEDVASRITSFTFANVDNNPIMSQVYAAFDGLVSNFPNIVSKQDAATVAGLSYPDYADGVYSTYVYKISNSNTYAGNTSVCKKKTLLLYAGTHGDEIAAMANCYVFASRLCNDLASDDNLFKLISAYDIYILPVLNGYGAIHNTRTNGNGVDLNRNFPTTNWSESGSGTDRYTGPSAGSEFETQLIMALVQEYSADVIVDHHNYAGLARQYYVTVPNERLRFITYQMLTECSLTFKKAYPEYFGSEFSLLLDVGDRAPLNVGSGQGTSTQWLADSGFSFGGVVEISDNINYLNGEVSTSQRDRWGASVFSIGEFTLRCALCHYCNEALK